VRVQALTSASGVQPGTDARYAVWVWFAPPASGNPQVTGDVTATLTAQPGRLSPTFTVCPVPGAATCLVSAGASPVQLVAEIPVPKKDAGTRLTLTATGSAPKAAAPVSASDNSVVVAAKPTPTPTPAGSTPAPVGIGVTLPPGTLPLGTLPAAALPSASLPALPNPAASPGLTFPPFSPSPNPAPAPSVHPIRVADVSAQFPLDTRLIGSQVVGLAVLAAAITIAVARLSLRKQRPQHGKDPS
jgi:hypothetical protein